jgi:hypothetical protein
VYRTAGQRESNIGEELVRNALMVCEVEGAVDKWEFYPRHYWDISLLHSNKTNGKVNTVLSCKKEICRLVMAKYLDIVTKEIIDSKFK